MSEDRSNTRRRATQATPSTGARSRQTARAATRSASPAPRGTSRRGGSAAGRAGVSGSARSSQVLKGKPRAGAARAAGTQSAGSGKHSRPPAARTAAASQRGGTRQARQAARPPAGKPGILGRLVANKVVLGVVIAVAVVVVGGALDVASNWGKAYGNVTVNGIAVGGMTEDEIRDALKDELSSRVSHAQVTIYSDEGAREQEDDAKAEEARATAEQVSAEEALSSVASWSTDAQSLKAAVPYETAAREALAVGRDEGGLAARLGLLFSPQDIELSVRFDEGSLEELASEIDRSIGDPRVDSTVVVEGGEATAVEGHDGTMVDRDWLALKISDAMIRGDAPDSFVAEPSPAPSRISLAEAQEVADAVNHAIGSGALFYYQGRSWLATPTEVGDWTSFDVVGAEGAWRLAPSIDSSSAIPAVVKGAGAAITSEDMTVRFEKVGSSVMVRTQGSGNIPEMAPAVSQLSERLYGGDGVAWNKGATPVEIEISESDRPESLSFDEAIDLGVITAIGEYTTEFSNLEGTENRNHNIKLCADILNDAVIDANGGEWNFNERSGDTNEAAGFWSAGSIVDGEFVDSIGGGICQVATTIFNAVYEAGLDVVERHNHTLYIASYPTGRDAAVSYPDLDFIWENKLPSDILMKLSYTDTSITAQLYSVYTGYSASTETGAWEDGKKYSVVYERDDTLASGYYYLKTVGEDGSTISIERTVSDEKGKVLKTDSFYSEYAPKDQVYVIGPGVDTSQLVRADNATSSASDDSIYDDYDYGYGYGSDYGYYDETAWY